MPNIVTDTIYDIWMSRGGVRRAPHGWMTNNAVCCIQRGESRDKRKRGGVKVDGEDISYHCFNCGFSTGYKLGGPLGIKVKTLLQWLDVPDNVIDNLKFEAFRLSSQNHGEVSTSNESSALLTIKSCELPPNSVPLIEVQDDARYKPHFDYIHSRGLSLDSYPFFVTSDRKNNMNERIILPFIRVGKIVGYTARAVKQNSLRYIMNLSSPYVFGIDLQYENWECCFAMEGPIDALSIGGIAFMGSEVSEDQVSLVKRLRRRIIVVPDYDHTGISLVDVAIANEWDVSFPEWDAGIKDVNQAVLKYGKLLATRMIIAAATNNKTEIKVRQRILQNKFKAE